MERLTLNSTKTTTSFLPSSLLLHCPQSDPLLVAHPSLFLVQRLEIFLPADGVEREVAEEVVRSHHAEWVVEAVNTGTLAS